MLTKNSRHAQSALLAIFLSFGSASAQDAPKTRDLNPILQEVLTKVNVPGIGAAIVNSEGLSALGVAGFRQRGLEIQIQRDDLFHIGSCTKAMTATLIGLFVQEEKLSWSTTFSKAFPQYSETMDEGWQNATIAQLLSHTAGMTNNFSKYEGLASIYRSKSKPMMEVRGNFVEGLIRRPPLTKPGAKFSYSNYGYVALGVAIEGLEKKSWEAAIKERLFEPLEMGNTGFGGPDAPYFSAEKAPVEADNPPQPRGHFENGKVAVAFDNVPALGPAGTVHCSLEDWGKFVRLHLRGAKGESGLLLDPSTFKVLHKADSKTFQMRDWLPSSFASGWVVTTRPWSKGKVLMHDGSNTAWFAYVWIAPEEDFAVLVACNQGGSLGRQAAELASQKIIASIVKSGKDETPTEK
jgi:CubicO group peptidase (beta-lactamase class C family)